LPDTITLKQIELVNFLSHERTLIDFSGQTVVIVGPNGAGKSSILDGILFALYRETSRNVNQDDLIQKGKKNARITLRLQDGKNDIEIVRSLGSNASITDLFLLSGTPKARSAKEVTNQVKNLLGIDKDTLQMTLFVSQGDVESVLDDLHEVFRKVINVEKIEKLRSSDGPIKAVMDEIDERLRKIEADMKLLAELETELKRLDDLFSRKRAEYHSLQEGLKSVSLAVQSLEKKLENLEAKRNEFLRLSQRKKDLEREIAELRKFIDANRQKLAEVPDVNEIDREIEDLNAKVQGKRRYDELAKEMSRVSSTLSALREEYAKLLDGLKRKQELRPKYENYVKLKETLNKLELQRKEFEKVKALLDNKLRELEEQRAKVEGLARPNVEEIERKLSALKRERNELTEKVGKLKAGIEEAKAHLEEISKAQGLCPVCRSPLTEEHKREVSEQLNSEITARQAELSRVTLKLKDLEKAIDELENAKTRAQAELQRYLLEKNRLNRLNDEVRNLQEKVNALATVAKEYDSMKSELESLERDYREYLALSNVDESVVEAKGKQIAELERRLSEIKEETDSLQHLKDFDERKGTQRLEELRRLKQRALELLELKERLREKEETLSQKTKELEEVSRELNGLAFDESEYVHVRKELEAKRAHLGKIEGQLKALEEEIARLEQERQEKARRVNEIKKNAEDYGRLAKAHAKLKKLRDVLSESRLQAFLFDSARKILEKTLNEIVNSFDLKYTTLEIAQEEGEGKKSGSKKGKMVIYGYLPGGEKVPVNAMSGGERVAIALALRLAFARVKSSNVGFVVLDEPTVFLDEYRRKELLEVIRRATQIVPQIILVTHDSELKDVGDQVISVVNEGGKSRVKVEAND
jgi:exonuclease SbcC